MRRNTRLVVMAIVSTLLVATVTGVALAKSIQCKPNTKCEGTRKADFLFGTPKPDRIFGLGCADNLSGDGGDDEIRNFDLTGNDTVDGGEGNDQLVSEGYDANEDNVVDPDTEDGGDDTVNGGEGDDTIDVQDEVGGDTVNCGGGTDTVAFDAGDTINADCENQ